MNSATNKTAMMTLYHSNEYQWNRLVWTVPDLILTTMKWKLQEGKDNPFLLTWHLIVTNEHRLVQIEPALTCTDNGMKFTNNEIYKQNCSFMCLKNCTFLVVIIVDRQKEFHHCHKKVHFHCKTREDWGNIVASGGLIRCLFDLTKFDEVFD